MLVKLLAAGALLAGLLAAQNTPRKAPPEVEEALKARVNEFYSLMQKSKFRQAEALVGEESRDIFYGMAKSPIRDFRLEKIQFADDFRSAEVVVACMAGNPRAASAGVYIPLTGKWRLLDGRWFLVIEPRQTTPFGPMRFDEPGAAKPLPFERPTLGAISANAFRVEPKSLEFPRQGPGTITRTVVISNNMPGMLQLEPEAFNMSGLKLNLPDKTIPPKGQITLQVAYDPQAGQLSGHREVRIRVQPLNQVIAIPVEFR